MSSSNGNGPTGHSPRIAVVLPTIAGREELLALTEAAYAASYGVEVRLLVVKGCATIGEGWEAGRRAALEPDSYADGWFPEYVHLSADDVEPAPAAMASAVACALAGVYPSPRILNPDGTLHSCGTLGAGMLMPEVEEGAPAGASPFPFWPVAFLAGVPSIPPIHYYADDWLGVWARRMGLEVQVSRAMELRHLEGTIGIDRLRRRAMADRAACLAALPLGDAYSDELEEADHG